MPTIDASLLDRSVRVDCPLDGVVAWLAEMLSPSFAVSAPSPAAARATVRVTVGDPVGEPGGQSFPCFALDAGVHPLPGRESGGAVVVHDARFGASYRLEPGAVTVVVPGDTPGARLAVFRVVRELAVATVRGPGRGQLHASAVATPEGVVALAGPKEAGKTTLAVHLASTGAALVSNDRVLVARDGAGWRAVGVPTIVSVRPATLALFPELARRVPAVERPVALSSRETAAALDAAGPVTAAHTRQPLGVSLAQIGEATGAPLSPGGSLRCVAFVHRDTTSRAFAVEALERDEARHALEAARLGAGAPRPATIFERVLGVDSPERQEQRTLARLADEVRCVAVHVGGRSLDDPDDARRLLAQLAGP